MVATRGYQSHDRSTSTTRAEEGFDGDGSGRVVVSDGGGSARARYDGRRVVGCFAWRRSRGGESDCPRRKSRAKKNSEKKKSRMPAWTLARRRRRVSQIIIPTSSDRVCPLHGGREADWWEASSGRRYSQWFSAGAGCLGGKRRDSQTSMGQRRWRPRGQPAWGVGGDEIFGADFLVVPVSSRLVPCRRCRCLGSSWTRTGW